MNIAPDTPIEEVPEELTTAEIIKLNNKIEMESWEEWIAIKWKRIK